MFFKLKTTKPKRDDSEYKEIEDFEDFELLNNAAYEMAIRTKEVKELFKIYNFCQSSIDKIEKFIASNKYNITGSKTGYLDEAKYCLMTRVSTATDNLIAINFGSTNKANNFLDNEKIIKYGLQLLKK